MARIKIEELPVMEDMSDKELKGILGGRGIAIEERPRNPWSRRGQRRGRGAVAMGALGGAIIPVWGPLKAGPLTQSPLAGGAGTVYSGGIGGLVVNPKR